MRNNGETKHENKHKYSTVGKWFMKLSIEVNNDLKVNVDEQQDDIKYLKNNVTYMMKIKFRISQLLETPCKKKGSVCAM